MSAEGLDALHLSDHSTAQQSLLLRLQQSLVSCSKQKHSESVIQMVPQSIIEQTFRLSAIESEDFHGTEASLSELVDFLDSISGAFVSDPCNDDSRNNAREVLLDIYQYLCSPSVDQAVIDALSFELPKAVAKFAGVDGRCMEIVDGVIERFIEYCSPRDMLSILCEALDSPTKTLKAPGYIAPILRGLSKVFLSIQRRHFEQVKVAVPVILNVLKAVSSESDDGDVDTDALFDRGIGIANSIHAVCLKLEGKLNEKLCALLGLYILQITAVLSTSIRDKVSSCLPLVLRLSRFFPYCGLSYLGFITGSDVDTLTSIILGEDEDDYMNCFSYVKHGAALAVIWGHIFGEVAQAAEENLTLVKDELRSNQTKRWQAICMLKHILSTVNLPWEFKQHTINFLLDITEGNISQNEEHTECSSYMPSLFAVLQAVEMVIIYASDAVLRKNAFDALKRMLADIPTSLRFDILKALITNSDSSSMIAILVDRVKEELRMENCQRIAMENNEVLQEENKASQTARFWSTGVLELVEFILRPPKGGPPSLPEQSDAVLSALNLYRFVLIAESAGKTNYTGVLSKNNLQKVYNEWLLPLRTLVTGTVAESQQDYDQLAIDTVHALNPVELVLYRCIELAEEKLKHST